MIGTGLLAPIRLGDGSGRGVGPVEAVAAGEVPAEAAGEGETLADGPAEGPGEGDPPGDGGNDWAGQGPLARTGATNPDPSTTNRASALLSAGPTASRAVRRPGLGDMPEAGIHSFGPTGPVADHAFV